MSELNIAMSCGWSAAGISARQHQGYTARTQDVVEEVAPVNVGRLRPQHLAHARRDEQDLA